MLGGLIVLAAICFIFALATGGAPHMNVWPLTIIGALFIIFMAG